MILSCAGRECKINAPDFQPRLNKLDQHGWSDGHIQASNQWRAARERNFHAPKTVERETMRSGTRSILGVAALVTLLASPPVAAAHVGSSAGVLGPLLLRITGFVGRVPDGIPTLGTFTVSVDSTVVTLDLSAVQTLNGPLTEGPAALRQFDLFTPNLLVVGDRGLLRQLAAAAPHTQITVFGYVHPGARRMFVVQVETA